MPHRQKPPAERAMIVTAAIAEQDIGPFHELRRRFFPGHRNFLSAHVTLFHHIRPAVRRQFIDFARNHYSGQSCFTVTVLPPFSLGGGGVAYGLEADPLIALRLPLRDRFAASLTSQDARPWKRPHITVQNKVNREEANRLLRHLGAAYEACTITVTGLKFFRYDYGPWTELGELRFPH